MTTTNSGSTKQGKLSRALSTARLRPFSRNTGKSGNATSGIAGLTLKMGKGKGGKLAGLMSPMTPVEQPEDLYGIIPPECIDLEMEFDMTMMPSLEDCSRQQLRLFHMNLLKYGANVHERVSSKDLLTAFQESNIKIPSRAVQLISEVYEDSKGIDYQRVYRRLEKAQAKTGRDSVNARHVVADRSLYNQIPSEVRDADFLRRVEEQLIKCPHYFDLNNYHKACLEKDVSKTGKLHKDQMQELAKIHTLPIYGALLTNLLNRCDDENNGLVSWPEFMNYLLKSMENYCTENPDKPKPGTTKPKLEQRSAVSRRGTHAINYVESADVHLEVQGGKEKSRTSDLIKSLGARMRNGREKSAVPAERRKSSIRRASRNDSPSQRRKPSHQGAVPSIDDPNIPTAEFTIKGRPMKFVIPSHMKKTQEAKVDPPTQRLKLDWVYGYNGRDVKNNISLISNGELMYAVGHIVILMNFQAGHKQRHYKEHTAQVTCLSLHSDKTTVASGQSLHKHNRSEIRIWRSDNLQTITVISDQQIVINNYTNLSFCVPQSKILSSTTSAARKHMCNQLLVGEIRAQGVVFFSVWDISTMHKISELELETEQLNYVEFNPILPSLIVTLGRNHFQWWKLNRETACISPGNEPNFGMHMKARNYTCAYHNSEGDLITGDSNGTVYVWSGGSHILSNLIKHAHEGPMTALRVINNTLITCGRDGMMKTWMYSFHLDKLFDVKLPPDDEVVRALLFHDGTLFLGSTANTLMSFNVEFDPNGYTSDFEFYPLPYCQGVVGQTVSTRTLSGLERSKFFLVSGSAGAIVLYDDEAKMAVGRAVLKDIQITCVDVCDNGELICAATSTGKVMLFYCGEGFTLERIATVSVCKSRLTFISLSPDAASIAAATSSTVYIISQCQQEEGDSEQQSERHSEDGTEEEWKVSGKFKVMTSGSPISHIDWSRETVDGSYVLRVCSLKSLQVTLWNPTTFKPIKSIQPHYSCMWSSQKCPLSYSIAGIWYSKQCRENELQCIDVNNTNSLIAMCDKQGYLCLFQHPCTSDGAFCHTYKSNVNTGEVNFTQNNLVLTSGVSDGCVMQWKIV